MLKVKCKDHLAIQDIVCSFLFFYNFKPTYEMQGSLYICFITNGYLMFIAWNEIKGSLYPNI